MPTDWQAWHTAYDDPGSGLSRRRRSVQTRIGAWLAQVDAASAYLAGVALPMVLIGAGQGLAFAPLTSFGIAGVRAEDAGAASGLVNTAHQLGMALGLALLVAVSARSGSVLVDRTTALASEVSSALTAGTCLLALCLVATRALIVRKEHSA